MAAKQKTFTISGFVKAWVNVEVKASSMEDALTTARGLVASDFLSPVEGGDIVDWNLAIEGISQPEVIDL